MMALQSTEPDQFWIPLFRDSLMINILDGYQNQENLKNPKNQGSDINKEN